MKKLVFTLLLTIPLLAQAQKNPDGFWGLNFYMEPGAVKDMIKARTGKLPEDGSGPTLMGYKNVEFAGYKVYYVQLLFNDDKLYGGDIVIAPEKSELLDVYNTIVAGIAAKYDKPQAKAKYSKATQPETTYEPSAGALKTTWTCPAGDNKGPGVRIQASIEGNVIKISYRDAAIYNQLVTTAEVLRQYDY